VWIIPYTLYYKVAMFEHKKVITMSPSVSVLKKILHIMVGCLAFMGKWYGAAMN